MAATNTPSRGGKPDKLMRDALMLALKREATNAQGQKTKYLNIVATKLVELAAEGDIQAIKEINDRVDGKATQAVELGGRGGGPMKLVVEYVSADHPDS